MSPENPYTGIFIKEQSELFARCYPEHNLGISTWGPNHEDLLLRLGKPFDILPKLFRKPKKAAIVISSNCVEYFSPAYTWTRKFFSGNINGILRANFENLKRFEDKFGRVDIIHAHVAYPAGFVAMQMAKKMKVPYAITEHMTPFPFVSFLKSGQISRRILEPIDNAAKVICVSDFLSNSINKQASANTCIINNFIDDDFFCPSPKSTDDTQTISLLFIGRLTEQKGVDILLEVFKLVSDKNENVRLLIGGSGERLTEYKLLSQQLEIEENVRWLGNLTRDQVKSQMQNCDIFVLPSRHENNPVILLEALACGKPIVVTSCGGPEELVTTYNGLIAEPEQKEDLADKILDIIENSKKYQATKIREEFILKHAYRKKTIQILEIYKELIK